ncbi:hypothetical protein E4T38_07866 [Aureobasidium subglaciale]|nr:hypothetical protein E4T38_07866 [Aureobasidium subglaciale]KAI5216559.1 hypothetical protein E4T40_07876 [Aureobasidium subglaciale]KAI5219822.1 hypothetical protein E4T41_07791 [Aureobasidium subglaciale]KAI5257742.1 hypothetical protein E4T46_07767 [Aureobasidium subglaciale]
MPAMAPFGIFTRRSFRRRPSTQSTSTPESASAQQKTDMGGVPSKAGSHVNDVPHRKLRHRSSSMNLLKRNRTPSGHASTRDPIATQASCDVDAALTDSTGLETEYTRGSLGARSDSQSTVKMLSGSVHSTSFANNKDNFYDSDSSSTRTATRVTPPSEAQEEVIVFGADDDSSGMSTPVPPRPPKTPQIQLPTPPFLTEDSPTKYGLRVTYSPSPDRSMAASQRQKMTGAGLFVHAATQQSQIHCPTANYDPISIDLSKMHPRSTLLMHFRYEPLSGHATETMTYGSVWAPTTNILSHVLYAMATTLQEMTS